MPSSREQKNDEDAETRRGPWTLEEDTILTHYIACNGEGRWNLLARCSGLKRTGKSCRLRWLNYLKPDVKRGNLTPQEQLLILELHSKWGNRWSRIAQHLPGRTDNEIKNYWRTRVQKQARQLKIDANSSRFRDAIRCFWMPRLLQKIESSSSSPLNSQNLSPTQLNQTPHTSSPPQYLVTNSEQNPPRDSDYSDKSSSENCSPSISTNSMKITQIPEILEFPASPPLAFGNIVNNPLSKGYYTNTNCDLEALDPVSTSAVTGYDYALHDCTVADNNWVYDVADSLWNMDEFWNVRKISGRGL